MDQDAFFIMSCERRIRTFTRSLAIEQKKNLWSTPIQRLLLYPHPRDRRAWLPFHHLTVCQIY